MELFLVIDAEGAPQLFSYGELCDKADAKDSAAYFAYCERDNPGWGEKEVARLCDIAGLLYIKRA